MSNKPLLDLHKPLYDIIETVISCHINRY